MTSNLIPAQIEKHFEIIQHGKDGSLILATSNLTGRYWKGSIWHYADSDSAPDIQKCCTGYEVDSGICDAKILDEPKVVISLDSGSLQLLDVTKYTADNAGEETLAFTEIFESTEHDSALYTLSISCGKEKIVSGSWDRSIKIWDVQSFIPSYTYKEAHSDIIWMVACHPKESDVFSSCSDDGELRMWDTRLPRPALRLGEEFIDFCITSIAWKPNEEHILIIGDEAGDLHVLDTRQNSCIHRIVGVHTRAFKGIYFSENMPSTFATCAFDTKIKVFTMTSGIPEQIYEDDSHTDFVRSLSWHPVNRKLYSCSWDSTIKSHMITVAMETNCYV